MFEIEHRIYPMPLSYVPERARKDIEAVYGPIIEAYYNPSLRLFAFVHEPDERGLSLYSMPNSLGMLGGHRDLLLFDAKPSDWKWMGTTDLRQARAGAPFVGTDESFPIYVLNEMAEQIVREKSSFESGSFDYDGQVYLLFSAVSTSDEGDYTSEAVLLLRAATNGEEMGQPHHDLVARKAFCGSELGNHFFVDLALLRAATAA